MTGSHSLSFTDTSTPDFANRRSARGSWSRPPVETTRAYRPLCGPAVSATSAPAAKPLGPRLTSFSSTFFTWRCRPCSSTYTICSLGARDSPGLMNCFVDASAAFGVAPRPSSVGRGTYSTGTTASFEPTPLPSSQPYPRSTAAPNSSIGIRS